MTNLPSGLGGFLGCGLLSGFQAGEFGFEAAAASGLIHSCRTYYDQIFTGYQSLRVLCRVSALHADGERLSDLVGDGEQFRHGMEWATEVIGIESGDDD